MDDKSHARLLNSDDNAAVAEHRGYGIPVKRSVEIGERDFKIVDCIDGNAEGVFSQVILDPSIKFECDGNSCRFWMPNCVDPVILRTSGTLSVRQWITSPCYGVVVPTSVIQWPIGAAVFEM